MTNSNEYPQVAVHFSFWAAAAVFWVMGLGGAFLMAVAAVSLHELAHILTARAFGCRLRRWNISALGEMAEIEGLNGLPPLKRTLVIAAGPACNLILWIVSGFSQRLLLWLPIETSAWLPIEISALPFDMQLFGFYNLVLCGFNLLPIFPLDGARLFQLWMGNWLGILWANRWCLRAARVVCAVLIVLGVVQAYFFAPNFTMLFAGVFFLQKNKDLQTELTGEFYMAMLSKRDKPAKIIYADFGRPLSDMVNVMGWDHCLVVILPDRCVVTEKEILDHVMKHGL